MKTKENVPLNPDYVKVMQQFTQLRETSGLHHLDVAVATGLEIEDIKRIEKGNPDVSLDHFVKYISLLGYGIRIDNLGTK